MTIDLGLLVLACINLFCIGCSLATIIKYKKLITNFKKEGDHDD